MKTVRIKNIVCPNDFIVSIKEGATPYPKNDDFTTYDTFTGNTSQIDLTEYSFETNKQYWIKIYDTINEKSIIQNIYI